MPLDHPLTHHVFVAVGNTRDEDARRRRELGEAGLSGDESDSSSDAFVDDDGDFAAMAQAAQRVQGARDFLLGQMMDEWPSCR